MSLTLKPPPGVNQAEYEQILEAYQYIEEFYGAPPLPGQIEIAYTGKFLQMSTDGETYEYIFEGNTPNAGRILYFNAPITPALVPGTSYTITYNLGSPYSTLVSVAPYTPPAS